MTDSPQKVAVLGAGSWGTALAAHLARCGHRTLLWGRDPALIQSIASDHVNPRYLPGIELPPTLEATTELARAVEGAAAIVVGVPSSALEKTLDTIKPLIQPREQPVALVWACKGFAGTRLLHEIVSAKLNDLCTAAVLSGPSFAKELARGLPTATTIASSDIAAAQRVCSFFHAERFRAYASADMAGVQLGGALKNIYAIATGVSDGLGFGANTRAALITRGMAEITRLALPLGGRVETLGGLSGMGDLVLTCTDDQSRNRRFGLALGRGESPQQAIDDIGQVVEGARAVQSALALAEIHKVELPIARQVHALVHEDQKAEIAVAEILARAPATEF